MFDTIEVPGTQTVAAHKDKVAPISKSDTLARYMKQVVTKHADELEQVARSLKEWKPEASPIIQATYFQITQGNVDQDNQLHEWLKDHDRGCRYIYLVMADSIAERENLYHVYRKYRDNNRVNRSLVLYNNAPSSTVLYLGTCRNILYRLYQHTGRASSGDFYTLNFKGWLPERADRSLQIQAYKFPADAPNPFVNNVSDPMWDELLPAFGRKGAT